jgi:small nuclear ribonucleoprotein B and B'
MISRLIPIIDLFSLHLQSMSRNQRILQLLNYRLKITIQDGRTFVGQMLAFDKHMNLVLSDCQETRKIKNQEKYEKRTLGLIVLRGDVIISISIESAPPTVDKARLQQGQGAAKPIGRGLPIPTGLQQPIRGVGMPPGFKPPM